MLTNRPVYVLYLFIAVGCLGVGGCGRQNATPVPEAQSAKVPVDEAAGGVAALKLPMLELPAIPREPVAFAAPAAPPLVNGRRPVVVLACANRKRLLEDVAFFSTAGGLPQLSTAVEALQRRWSDSIDDQRPLGAFVLADRTTPRTVTFLPVKDAKAFRLNMQAWADYGCGT